MSDSKILKETSSICLELARLSGGKTGLAGEDEAADRVELEGEAGEGLGEAVVVLALGGELLGDRPGIEALVGQRPLQALQRP